MLNNFFTKNTFLLFFFLAIISIIKCQILINECIYDDLKINTTITSFNDDIIQDLITENFPRLYNNSLFYSFNEEYNILLFRKSNCSNILWNLNNIPEYNFTNKLHLFSIKGEEENNPEIIKFVIQTKKEFNIIYYNNFLTRIYYYNFDIDNSTEKFYYINTNIFPFLRRKLLYEEEFQIFKNQKINIFNEEEKIFNDYCYIFNNFNITTTPELRKNLYFYKYDNSTYPLLNSSNNCFINNIIIEYENETFNVEYKCYKNYNVSVEDIQISGISIENERKNYKGPNSLKDQEKILYCHKESFKTKYIKNNVGFYMSLALLIIAFFSLIFLFIQKYEIKYGDEILEAPPKKKTIKEAIKEKKKDNFTNVEIINEKKNKKKKSKKKKMIESDDNIEENNKEDSNDLNWYSNKIIIDSDKEKENSVDDYYNTDKPKKKKKKKKKKKRNKKKEKNIFNMNNSYENNKSNEDNDNNSSDINDIKNKTITKFPSAYKKFKINYENQLKEELNLRRLVIITNLGKNIEKSDININNNQQILNKSNNEENKNSDSFSQDNESKNNFNNKNNNILVPVLKNSVEDDENSKNEKLGNILGLEDDTFMSNISRDYLKYKDALYFERRENCHLFRHFMKLKNDFINIFYPKYSFSPYTARLIKFVFFFHFLLYLETLCIGQKYYFEKYYSKEIQDFLKENNNKTENDFNNIHYLYTFKYAFPRVLIPAALSLISYFFSSILSPRRKIMKIILNEDYNINTKNNKIKKIAHNYKIVFIFFGILALLLMVFFFYSMVNYFTIFEDAKYDIPQSFLLSGLLIFIFDIILWAFFAELRLCSIQSHNEGFYNFINKLYEMN